MRRFFFPALALFAAPLLATAALAQASDPAATVSALDAGLIALMHDKGGQQARSHAIAPVIDRSFDLAAMTRLAVGPEWPKIAAREQAGLVSAFRAMTVAQYARNFDGWSGQRFVLVGAVEARGGDRLVRTELVSPGGDKEALAYRLREDAPGSGRWRIIDVYYRNGISQLATRRSDFATVLARGGAPALIAHLQALANNPK